MYKRHYPTFGETSEMATQSSLQKKPVEKKPGQAATILQAPGAWKATLTQLLVTLIVLTKSTAKTWV